MNGAVSTIDFLGTLEWNAELHGALSVVSRLALSVKKRANVIHVAAFLRTTNRKLRLLFDTIDAAVEGKIAPDPNAEPLTPQKIHQVASEVEQLAHVIDYVYESLRRVGLTNNSLTAGQLRAFHGYHEPLLDLADWIELAAQSEQVEAIFKRAAEERERGEVADLQRVE